MFADAESYERFMGRWSRILAPKFVAFSGVADRMRVLDAGCGTGALTDAVLAAHPYCRVLGIDPSPEYVAYAKSHLSSGAADFEAGDAQDLRHPAASFDACISLLVFNFIPDPAKALAELRRLTRPGGVVAAAVWDYPADMQMLRIFWNAVVRLSPPADRFDERHMPLCRQGELGHLWRSGGLQSVEERPLDIKMSFGSFADYWKPFLEGQGPAGKYVASLGSGERKALESSLRQHLETGPEGAFQLRGRAWAVRGSAPR